MSPLSIEHCSTAIHINSLICKSSEPKKSPRERTAGPEKSPKIPDGFLVEHILEFLERYQSTPRPPLGKSSRTC
jgi:hypothetical protein